MGRIFGRNVRVLHLYILVVVLTALVVGGKNSARQQGAFGFEFELLSVFEGDESRRFTVGHFSALALDVFQFLEGSIAFAFDGFGVLLAQFGQSATFSDGSLFFAG